MGSCYVLDDIINLSSAQINMCVEEHEYKYCE